MLTCLDTEMSGSGERVSRVSTIFVFEPRKIIILENSTMTNHRPILFYYFVHVKEKNLIH